MNFILQFLNFIESTETMSQRKPRRCGICCGMGHDKRNCQRKDTLTTAAPLEALPIVEKRRITTPLPNQQQQRPSSPSTDSPTLTEQLIEQENNLCTAQHYQELNENSNNSDNKNSNNSDNEISPENSKKTLMIQAS